MVEKAIAALPGGIATIYLRGDSALYEHELISGAHQQRTLCRQSPFRAGAHATIVERQAYFGQITAARAQALQTAQPALEALYQTLSPEQCEVLDRPMSGHRHHYDGDWRHGRQRESD